MSVCFAVADYSNDSQKKGKEMTGQHLGRNKEGKWHLNDILNQFH